MRRSQRKGTIVIRARHDLRCQPHSKSVVRKDVWVQVPPPVLCFLGVCDRVVAHVSTQTLGLWTGSPTNRERRSLLCFFPAGHTAARGRGDRRKVLSVRLSGLESWATLELAARTVPAAAEPRHPWNRGRWRHGPAGCDDPGPFTTGSIAWNSTRQCGATDVFNGKTATPLPR